MKMKTRHTAILVLAASPWWAMAQQNRNGAISEQVEVTRQYNYDPDRSVHKLDVQPQMIDTTTIRPDFSYSIEPAPYLEPFEAPTLRPMRVNAERYRYLTPYYLKVGAGWPWNGVLDFYMADRNEQGLSYGASLNHLGQYDRARTDLPADLGGGSRRAFDLRNRAGAFLGKELGRYDLRAEIDANYDLYDSYGQFAIDSRPLTDYGASDKLNYKGLKIDVEGGNDFSNMSYFNFRMGGGLDMFTDRTNLWESHVEAFAQIGKTFGEIHHITLEGEYCNYFKRKDEQCFTVSPLYTTHYDNLNFRLGANIAIEHGKTWIFPVVSLSCDIVHGYLTPFIDLDGRFEHGDLRRTVRLNPYVGDNVEVEDMGEYNFKGGIMGSLSQRLSYKVFAGVNFYRDMSFFAGDYREGSTSRFIVLTDNCTAYTLGGTIDYRVADRLHLWASANINAYHMDHYKKAGGLPLGNIALGGQWNFARRWSATLSGEVIGSRHFYSWVDSDQTVWINKVDPCFDLKAKLGCRLSRFISLWAEGDNLCGSRLYPWNHYRSVGAAFTAGATMSF
ncbi:hypothetical protein FACS1894159_04150 [Bacteroidia bacterium]|nr:hypothetical protein FACS1894159_04150 [Bacteroidia bacterium]